MRTLAKGGRWRSGITDRYPHHTGQLVLANFAALAQFERDRIAERTREALAVKRSQGVRPGQTVGAAHETVARVLTERMPG